MLPNNEHLTRQLDLIPVNLLGEPITIIGAGAVGGWTALSLAKMGFGNIQVIDFDTVSIENMSCQFFRRSDIDKNKAVALSELIHSFTGTKVFAVTSEYKSGTFGGIVIAAVDSMAVRKKLWLNHAGIAASTKLIIDPRMGAETALLYCMDPRRGADNDTYLKTLYSDEQAVREPCTRKSSQYCALSLAGLVCAQVKNVLTGNKYLRTAQFDIPKGALSAWQNE